MKLQRLFGAEIAKALAVAMLTAAAGLAHALPFPTFQGRLADGTASDTCTATGANSTIKCTTIYNTTLNITILNDWYIGAGPWSATSTAGSAQEAAEIAGIQDTGLTGWVLPTIDQYLSIWLDVGQTFAGLSSEFAHVEQFEGFWSASEKDAGEAWYFYAADGSQQSGAKTNPMWALAVRSGDVIPVTEPASLALALVGLAAAGVTRRRRVSA